MKDSVLAQQFLEIVDKQLHKNEPPMTKTTLDRLLKQGYSEKEAKYLIAQCVAHEMMKVFETDKPYDEARYIVTLQNLPDPPR